MEARITTVAITPGNANVVNGQISVMKTFSSYIDKMMLKPMAGLRVNLSEAGSRTRGDAVALFLEELQKAKNYLAIQKLEDDKLEYDLKLGIMVDVLDE